MEDIFSIFKKIISLFAANAFLLWIVFVVIVKMIGKNKSFPVKKRLPLNYSLNIQNELLQKINGLSALSKNEKTIQNISATEIEELIKDPELLKIKVLEALSSGQAQGGKTISSSGGSSVPFVFSPALAAKSKSRQGYSRTKSLAYNSRRPGKGLHARQKYLQIALNGSLADALRIISKIPLSDRVLIEVGTPLIKASGMEAIRSIKMAIEARSFFSAFNKPYIVADIKTADLSQREVVMAKKAGASAATCLGVAPIETINAFISACQKNKIDAMIDMMNVENPQEILKKLKDQPRAVIVHRGVDETDSDKSKLIPYYQINQIKGVSGTMVSVAGGDSISEIRSAIFNGADIIVLWKAFYRYTRETEELVREFLKEIR